MNDMCTERNPFRLWAGIARGLRDRFAAEVQSDGLPASAYTDEVMGALAGMITRCEHMAISLERFQHHDTKAFEAFMRALGNS